MAKWEIQIPRSATALLCTLLQLCFGTVYAWRLLSNASGQTTRLGRSQKPPGLLVSRSFPSAHPQPGQAATLPRFGPRKLAVAGSIMFSGGYMIASLALHLDSIPLFYLGYGVIGGAGIGLGYVTPVATAAKWFPDRKGLVTGIVVMGFGVGAFLLSKVLAPFLVLQTESDLTYVFLWLGIVFACILLPSSFVLSDPKTAVVPAVADDDPMEFEDTVAPYLRSSEFVLMWIVFFFNHRRRASPSSAFSRNSCKNVWGLADPSLEPITLAEYGATLIAVSSLCNGVGRLFWGLLSDRIGRVGVFRILLASQMNRLRHLNDRAQPLDLFRARLLCPVVLWRRLCHNAIFCSRRLWQQKNVHHLRGNPNRLGRSGNLWPALRGLSERPNTPTAQSSIAS